MTDNRKDVTNQGRSEDPVEEETKVRSWKTKHPDWISNHFYMGEFIYSAAAVEAGLDNTPPPEAQAAIRNLVEKLLEPLRGCFGSAIQVSSGFRCADLNRLVGGVANSQHLTGEGADIFTFGSNRLLETLKDSRLDFDQAIFYRRKNFMHLSLKYKGQNRRQISIR